MVNIVETAQWEAGVNEISTTDVVVGAATGPVNVQAQQLANRSAYLKQQVEAHAAAVDPHTQYLKKAVAATLYKDINAIDVPVGTVLTGYFNAPPAGFIEPNGALLTRTSYPDLWAHALALEAAVAGVLVSDALWLSTPNNAGLFSSGNGTTTFRLPDLRDVFTRSKSAARGLGSFQNDDLKTHKHAMGNLITNVTATGVTHTLYLTV